MKRLKYLLLIIMILIISGCNVKSKREVISYVNKKFGNAILISNEQYEEEGANYTFKDTKDYFLYECSSYMYDYSIDNATLFTLPKISCSFEEEYSKIILDKIRKDNSITKNNFTIDLVEYQSGDEELQFKIYTNNLGTKDIYIPIENALRKIDSRGYYRNFDLQIYDDKTKEKLGVLKTIEKKVGIVIVGRDYELLTTEQEDDKWFISYVKRTYSETGKGDSNEIEFIRKEKNVLIKDRSEIYNGLKRRPYAGQDEDLETATTNIYYFYDKVAKINFYIIDYYVTGQQCFFNNYSATVRNENTNLYMNGCQW